MIILSLAMKTMKNSIKTLDIQLHYQISYQIYKSDPTRTSFPGYSVRTHRKWKTITIKASLKQNNELTVRLELKWWPENGYNQTRISWAYEQQGGHAVSMNYHKNGTCDKYTINTVV